MRRYQPEHGRGSRRQRDEFGRFESESDRPRGNYRSAGHFGGNYPSQYASPHPGDGRSDFYRGENYSGSRDFEQDYDDRFGDRYASDSYQDRYDRRSGGPSGAWGSDEIGPDPNRFRHDSGDGRNYPPDWRGSSHPWHGGARDWNDESLQGYRGNDRDFQMNRGNAGYRAESRGGYSQQGHSSSYLDNRELGGNGGQFDRFSQGGQFAGRGPKGYRRSDERIQEDVCEALSRHPGLDAGDIEVKVHNGEVTLSGTVSDRHDKRMAEDCVEHCSGVQDVRNEIRVKRESGSNDQSHDNKGKSPVGTGSTSRVGESKTA